MGHPDNGARYGNSPGHEGPATPILADFPAWKSKLAASKFFFHAYKFFFHAYKFFFHAYKFFFLGVKFELLGVKL